MKKEEKKNSSILGTYSGKCCDSNVFNNNDMHLSRKLFENLLASEDYQRALANRHYISFLGHPDDPDCQDYKNACMVMTDMRILDNGEIEGDFDLVDTPVGQVVKSFIDAGVNFGISIRGLGDVGIDGEVDPESFVFRGFDLVTFPAYDDCIPEFKAIAASTDINKQSIYKKVCASIESNLPSIDDPISLGVIQEQLTEGSEPYNEVQQRLDQLMATDNTIEEALDITEQKLEAMTDLYLDAAEKARNLEIDLATCQSENADLIIECKTQKTKYTRFKKIVASQLATAQDNCNALEDENDALTDKVNRTRRSLQTVRANLDVMRENLADVERKYKEEVKASKKLRSDLDDMIKDQEEDKKVIEASNNLNLKYQRNIEANSETISQKDSAIEDLKQQLHETVVARKELESEASNLDDKCNELLSRVEAAEKMVFDYQQAYANMYANALGVYVSDLPITASTSVEDLKKMITAGTSTASIPAGPGYIDESDDDYYEEDGTDISDIFDDVTQYSSEMVSM